MPRSFVHFTFFLFVITAISGVWMRLFSIHPSSAIPYTNVMHGHSHLAILGWAFLGVFIIFLSIFWHEIKQKKQATFLTILLFVVSFVMFIAFVYQGYGVFSIIMSTAHIFVEYWAAIFILRQLKRQRKLPKAGSLFIKGSLIALIISSIGPFSLGFISANGLRDSYLFDMAIYFYLHFQYNGWLYLFLIGLFIIILHTKRIQVNHFLLKTGFWVYFIALFPGYFLSVLWVDLGTYSTTLAAIGSVGQWIGVLCVLIAFKSIWSVLKRHYATLTIACLLVTFGLLFLKSTMELGLMSKALASLVYDTRSVIIGYLHFTLLGFVSIFILTAFQMTQILNPYKRSVLVGFGIFFIGFLLNELLLFSSGLARWIGLGGIPLYAEGLLLASGLLLIGILILWTSVRKKVRFF